MDFHRLGRISFMAWLGGGGTGYHRGNISEGLHLVSRRRCPGVILVVHLRSVVLRLRVGVETQLVVITCVHPQKVGVIAVPVVIFTEDARGQGEGCTQLLIA